MKVMKFSIIINASKDKVWNTMLNEKTYKEWTSVFTEGSYYEGSWEKDAKIKFLSPGGDGMSSVIVENNKYEFISIKHLGNIKNGVEDFDSPEVKKWYPAFENYTFTDKKGITELKVDMVNITEEFADMFKDIWPKALSKLKQICERK